MCSNFLHWQRLTSALRLFRLPAAVAGLVWLAAPAPLSAEPFALQQWQAADPEPEAKTLASFSPYYGGALDRRPGEQSWRDTHAVSESGERREIPTGFIASIGRWGLQVDSSGSGPRIRGIAWAPTETVSVVAGGNLGDSDGVGASLSVRIGF